jgi:hypothetical protein
MSHSVPAKKPQNGDYNEVHNKEEDGLSLSLGVLKQRLMGENLTPKDVREGLLVLSEVGGTALAHAVRNGSELSLIHEHLHDEKAILELVRGQVLVIASKVETTNRFMDKVDNDMCEGFRLFKSEVIALHQEVTELKALVLSVLGAVRTEVK